MSPSPDERSELQLPSAHDGLLDPRRQFAGVNTYYRQRPRNAALMRMEDTEKDVRRAEMPVAVVFGDRRGAPKRRLRGLAP